MSDATKKVVINTCFGGFSLSTAALDRFEERGLVIETYEHDGVTYRDEYAFYRAFDRSDALLVEIVEELGELANGEYATLKIVEIPADVSFVIAEYDGNEHIAEVHRTWS